MKTKLFTWLLLVLRCPCCMKEERLSFYDFAHLWRWLHQDKKEVNCPNCGANLGLDIEAELIPLKQHENLRQGLQSRKGTKKKI